MSISRLGAIAHAARPTALAFLAALTFAACGSPAAGSLPSSSSALQVFAASSTATPAPTPQASAAPPDPTATAKPTATVTPGPIAYVVDFTFERKELTLHVGQAIQLQLTSGPKGDWLSGVDDARVLLPISPADNGVYQAIAPGTTLVTANVPFGCANVTPATPCRPDNQSRLFQMRVYVLP